MGRLYIRDKVNLHRRHKTRDFMDIKQLTNFMVQHLYGLYDQLEEVVEFSDDWDYLQGSVDTTQVYLLKCGVEYLDQTAYIEKVDNQKWVRA
jgi:hypothetical protein